MEVLLPERQQNETYRWEAFVEFFNGKEWVLEKNPVYVKTSKEDLGVVLLLTELCVAAACCLDTAI